jgi:hypothetical protein
MSLESEDFNAEMRSMKEETVKLTTALLEKDKTLTLLRNEVWLGPLFTPACDTLRMDELG